MLPEAKKKLLESLETSKEQYYMKFERLIVDGLITVEQLQDILKESVSSASFPEELLRDSGVPKHEILNCISRHYGLPFMEYNERLKVPAAITQQVDMERLKKSLWFPLSVKDNTAHVIVYDPLDEARIKEMREVLKVERVKKIVALPSDLIRIIENNQDVNPSFPPSAGRTPLARVRTYLAARRTQLAAYRTVLARGRTGLAFMRTGSSFLTIALLMLRMFGIGYFMLLEAPLFLLGIWMLVDGLVWYLPARKAGKRALYYTATEPTFGTTVLQVNGSGNDITRTGRIDGSDQLRTGWNRLSPVMRRRFLAIDRTDLAEERTFLAYCRTMMARARNGLAFTRTGIVFIGLGIGLLRQFSAGLWTVFDGALICLGMAMTMEGFYWYAPGRRAGKESLNVMQRMDEKVSIWDFMFPPLHERPRGGDLPSSFSIKETHAPGIWGTTGLALERTLFAERRNVKTRLRTIMARSRTGMAFIRTGTRIFSVGLVLLVYFGTDNGVWAAFNMALMVVGLILIADGFYWHLPAEKIRKELPYCFVDMEIHIPDYGRPSSSWKRAIFSHDDS